MKAKLALGALLVSMALANQVWAVELLPGLRGLKGGPCYEPCGEPVKCAVPEPKACEPACVSCEVSCKPKHDLLAGLKQLFQRKCDPCAAAVPACEPVKCAVPEPKACEPSEAACPPCREKPLRKVLCKICEAKVCEPPACEAKAAQPEACEAACPGTVKCRPQVLLKILHTLFGKKGCHELEQCDVCGSSAPAAPTPATPKAAEPAPLPKAPKPDAEAQLNPPRSISQASRSLARY